MSAVRFPSKTRERLERRDGDRCFYCRREFDDTNLGTSCTIDHYVPRTLGGSHKLTNLRLACYRCNHAKSHMMGDQFLKSPYLRERRRYVSNCLKRERNRLLNSMGLRTDGQGYWHEKIVWIEGGDRVRCVGCHVELNDFNHLRFIPCKEIVCSSIEASSSRSAA